jgi:hypothetical protein
MAENEPTNSVTAPTTEKKEPESDKPPPPKVSNEGDSGRDSEAEKRDADAAKKIAYYLPNRRDRLITWTTKWSPLVTFFNLSLIVFTFFLVTITNKQADISDRQTRDNEAIQRAFVNFDKVTSYKNVQDGALIGYSFAVDVSNSGTTPATNVFMFNDHKLMAKFPEHYRYSEEAPWPGHNGGFLGPKGVGGLAS